MPRPTYLDTLTHELPALPGHAAALPWRSGKVVRFAAAAAPKRGPAPAAKRRRAAAAPAAAAPGHHPSGVRVEAAPPPLRHAPDSAWQRLVFWLMAPAPHDAAPPLSRLAAVREDFLLAVADLPGAAAHALRFRIAHAHSLRDLWHLRNEVFSLVGLEHAQGEAEERLRGLNRHFPRRATRSQFGSFA